MRTLTFTIIFLSIAVFTQAGMLTLSEKLLAEEKQNVNNSSPEIFDKQYIKNIMDKVNQYQLTHPHRKFDDNWIRGTYYTGVMACYQATGDKKYLAQCDSLGETLQWKIPAGKRDSQNGGGNLLTLGQTWIESYMENPETKACCNGDSTSATAP